MRESALEAKMRGIVQSRGGLFLKWVSPGYTGVPDRIAFMPGGKIMFVEVKRPGLKDGRSARQKRVGKILTGLGQKVITVNSIEDFEEALNDL